MNNKDIILFIVVILTIYLLYCNNKKEYFTSTSTSSLDLTSESLNTLINEKVRESINRLSNDSVTESIKNLGLMAKRINDSEGNLTFPANVVAFGDIHAYNSPLLPIGSIISYYTENNSIDKSLIPNNWVYCDGLYYKKSQYLEEGEDNNGIEREPITNREQYIKSPNLIGRFIVGSKITDSVYGATTNNDKRYGEHNYGNLPLYKNIGGESRHKLTVGELAKHKHLSGYYRIADSLGGGTNSNNTSEISYGKYDGIYYSNSNKTKINEGSTGSRFNDGNNHYDPLGRVGGGNHGVMQDYSEPIGGDSFHNNMPPFYGLVYLMRI
jgi:hypothetical protein